MYSSNLSKTIVAAKPTELLITRFQGDHVCLAGVDDRCSAGGTTSSMIGGISGREEDQDGQFAAKARVSGAVRGGRYLFLPDVDVVVVVVDVMPT